MSRRVTLPGGQHVIVIESEEPDTCTQCGVVEELRPYGPNFTRICHGCAQKDPKGTKRRMQQVLFGEVTDV